MLEIDRKDVEIGIARDRLKDMTEMAERSRRERDLAQSLASESQKECALIADRTKHMLAKKDDEISDMLER